MMWEPVTRRTPLSKTLRQIAEDGDDKISFYG